MKNKERKLPRRIIMQHNNQNFTEVIYSIWKGHEKIWRHNAVLLCNKLPRFINLIWKGMKNKERILPRRIGMQHNN